MASFYQSTVAEFLALTDDFILARLATEYASRGFTSQYTDQTLTWGRDLRLLRSALVSCVTASETAAAWGLILEFSIPRKERRIDVVLLIRETIVILEAKTAQAASQAKQQIEEYTLLLHYFHKGSNNRRIIPVLVSADASQPDLIELSQKELFPQLPCYWIAPIVRGRWDNLADILIEVEDPSRKQIDATEWANSPYFPVPSIIEAASALRTGLSIREIAHSEAAEHEIQAVCETVQDCVNRARTQGRHAICFLTGVPGSGKTLVGLSLAHSDENMVDAIHFMSGNGPLVKVLQHLFTQEGMREGTPAPQARLKAATLIENVHVFARNYTGDDLGAPSNHAIIFDEAQRAWNKSQNLKKFKRDYSEPEMLLKIMERHSDWAVVVALVGGGQEINDGEAGLEEWGRALAGSTKDWLIYASPEVLGGGASTAGHRLFADGATQRRVETNNSLHLRTSNRSLRAEQLAKWVNCLLDGDFVGAASLEINKRFPVFLSRDLNETRSTLKRHCRGIDRQGLVGSSGATRLRAEGLEPNSTFHADYPWEHWYLADQTDIRSSYRCEVFATEFEIQGLELDWIGLCWGGDFIWDGRQDWLLRTLRHGSPSRWSSIKSPDKRIYRRNAYRVLLTRARKGMVLFVPTGDPNDPTRLPEEFDRTAEYLIRCGVVPLNESTVPLQLNQLTLGPI